MSPGWRNLGWPPPFFSACCVRPPQCSQGRRSEARRAVRRVRRETSYAPGGALAAALPAPTPTTEQQVLAAEERRALRAAVGRLPGRCPELMTALLSRSDPTYQEISVELGISQGSLGPLRSRCLGCLRTILTSRIAAPVRRGKPR
jgi:DNA-directed RNA polymerase specialized sigma24 family protein